MPEAPTPWELQRQLDREITRLREDLKAAIDRAEHHVTDTGLAALLTRYEDRIEALSEAVAQERGMRAVDIEGLRREIDREIKRLEKHAEKTDVERVEERRERRADRRVVYGGAFASATALVLWVLEKWPGGGT